MGITRRFKSYFLRGMAVLLPTMLTIWIFIWGYGFIQENISIHINRGLVRLIMFVQGEGGVSKDVLDTIWVKGPGSIAGFIMALIAVCMVGALLASVVGRTLWRIIEKFIMNTPFLKRVYPYIKQVTDFFLTQDGQDKLSFSRVVAAEYPRKGIWSIGMVTGSGLKKVVDNIEKELLTVFVPTSPTPFTGFIIMVPKEQTIDLDMTIEEAFRFTVSGGVITPGNNQTATATAAVSALPKTDSESKEER
ncbi:MAG TPA: DUF502 domain-containing protein [Phycisphaerales bacterium]|nr:DUF502 domain-containing protein [Phycisphaerales bacterium]